MDREMDIDKNNRPVVISANKEYEKTALWAEEKNNARRSNENKNR